MRNFATFIAPIFMALLVLACGGREPALLASPISSPTPDPCIETEDPELLLACGRFSQRVYWLGDELAVPDAPHLAFTLSYIDDGDEPISPRTRLVIGYAPKNAPQAATATIYLSQWYRPAWEEFTAQFTGYDPSTDPPEGPINWWQHPCVEGEVYLASNGAEVHLFKAHLVSLIYIFPMTPEEVAQCLNQPVGAVGAHIYFDETVVEFSVQHDVSPAGPLPGPIPIAPGTEPSVEPTPLPLPTLVLRNKNPYNDVEIIRHIAASLQSYEGH